MGRDHVTPSTSMKLGATSRLFLYWFMSLRHGRAFCPNSGTLVLDYFLRAGKDDSVDQDARALEDAR